jgi:hypothetical protein
MTNDNYITTEPEIYEEPPLPVDPRDEAYTEAKEEIERLKKTIERLKRETK